MKRNKLILFIVCFAVVALLTSGITAFAVTEAEVQQYVDANGKEAATGNVFIWFICAIAFLKVSQKIDSFMGALGISVGHTGGSMLTEAMIAARGFGGIRRGSGGGGGRGRGTSSAGGFMAGGLAGAVGRKFSAGAANAATGKDGGGIVGGLGGMAYDASVKKGGKLANDVIGSVAKGDISDKGVISGEKASDALKSYMGITAATNSQVNSNVSGGSVSKNVDISGTGGTPAGASPVPTENSIPTSPVSGENGMLPSDSIEGIPDSAPGMAMEEAPAITESAGIASGLDAEIGMETAGIPLSPEAAAGAVIASEISDAESVNMPAAPIPANPVTDSGGQVAPVPTSVSDGQPTASSAVPTSPTFENVEIGGGRITGTEYSPAHPGGAEFAMYHSEKYMPPQSNYEMVKMIDGSKWYKQYAMPAVEKTPYMGDKGKVKYSEKIVDKVPPVPQRKDKI